jgi:hypothetical protein
MDVGNDLGLYAIPAAAQQTQGELYDVAKVMAHALCGSVV